VARHEDVQRVLSDWETFSSAAGVGLADFNTEQPWRPPSLVLEADPPLHTRTRKVLTRVLSPGNIRKLRDQFAREAEALVDRVVALGHFDGIKDFAEPYPVKAFPDALGLAAEGREHLLLYGSMVFNSFGPRNTLIEAAFANADAVRGWIMENCARRKLTPHGLGAQIYAAVDSGELSAEEAPMLVRSFLSAGVDTAVDALGNTLWCLATFNDQWEKLRQNHSWYVTPSRKRCATKALCKSSSAPRYERPRLVTCLSGGARRLRPLWLLPIATRAAGPTRTDSTSSAAPRGTRR